MMTPHLMGFGNQGGMLAPVTSHVKCFVSYGSLGIVQLHLNPSIILRFMCFLAFRVNFTSLGCTTRVGSGILRVAYKYLSRNQVRFFYLPFLSFVFYILFGQYLVILQLPDTLFTTVSDYYHTFGHLVFTISGIPPTSRHLFLIQVFSFYFVV